MLCSGRHKQHRRFELPHTAKAKGVTVNQAGLSPQKSKQPCCRFWSRTWLYSKKSWRALLFSFSKL